MKQVLFFIFIFVVAGTAVFSSAQTPPNVIYGYVKNGDGTPMAGAEVWYCTLTAPEPFSECISNQIPGSSGSGLWALTSAKPNFYYRFWATFPGSYSQSKTFSYSGGEKYWGTLILVNNPQPSKPAIRLLSPNGGEKLSVGTSATIRWESYNVSPDAEVSITLFRSNANPVKEYICDITSNCTSSTYNWVANAAYRIKNYGSFIWKVPTVSMQANDYFLRVSCYSPSCGDDDSDNPFSIGLFLQAPPPVAPPPAPAPVSIAPPSLPVSISVKGSVKLVNGNSVDAFVWAWSEKGKSVSAKAGLDGTFELVLTRDDTWHVDAGKVINETAYTYSDIIDIAADTVSVGPLEIILISESLPPSVILTRPATEEVIAKVEDGASVIIPPQAAALDGTVTVEVQPIVGAPSFIDEVASFLAVKIVSTVYELVIKDQQGKEIKELREAVEILLPYKDEELKKLGVSEDKIYAAFFDELKGIWVKIGDYAIDKLKNVIRAKVKHLTRFAIVAPADVSPPESPSNKKAEVLKDGNVKLSWVNPKRDFHHVKIYRSEVLKNFGSVVFNDLTGTFALDRGLSGGKIYYYLIRSIDPAGNESENTVQLSVKTPAVVIKEAPKILEEEKEPEKPAIKETAAEIIVQPAPVITEETPAPIAEKAGFFLRIWQTIARFFRSMF